MAASSALSLVCLIIFTGANAVGTFKKEAENLLGPHNRHWRSNASGLKTIYVDNANIQLSFPFCLHADVTADVTVAYSKDGLDSDTVAVKVGDTQVGSFATVAESNYGANWDVFRNHTVAGIALSRGLGRLRLTFPSLSQYGVEIDYIEVKVYDDFIIEQVFNCSLVLGDEPTFAASQASGVADGYVEQHSYVTPCPEEDNVHLSVYHASVSKYTLTATNPLYRTFYDEKLPDTSTCPNLDPIYWKFLQVDSSNLGTTVNADDPINNPNNATVTGQVLSNDPVYTSKFTFTFDLKGFSTGFIDADIHSELELRFSSVASSGVSVKVTYTGKSQTSETVLEVFDVTADTDKKLEIPEMTWSEDFPNHVFVYVSDDVTLEDVQLVRGVMTEEKVDIYKNDAVVVEGTRVNFWWRKPAGETLTVEIQGQTVTDLAFVAIMVPVPWGGASNWQQIFVLYQDGNVRLVPLPQGSPDPGHWTPFGTSVIVGKSNPQHLRPAAGIQRLLFNPETFRMTLTYYDGSTCDMDLTYGVHETSLVVQNLNFASSTSGLPFATFRSMFVEFGRTDSDTVQTDAQGPRHVLDTSWSTLSGKEFKVFRYVESRHLSQSPDISLKIEE